MNKAVQYITRGMQRDLSLSKFNPEFSFENMNIRITSREHGTLLSLSNERGNKELITSGDLLKGTYLGHAIINNILVLFTKDDVSNNDYIHKITYIEVSDSFINKTLYIGKLNFNTQYPIETLVMYENDNIQKVYWIDGINQPRIINISDISRISQANLSKDTTFFNFVPTLSLKENIIINRSSSSTGIFDTGTIQYCFTYYNIYGQESNIVNISDLGYITHSDRGGSPEDKISTSFNIVITNLEQKFDYLRLYSIHRSSQDATPTVKVVSDIKLNNQSYIDYIDTNTGYIIDPTLLFYIGGEDIVPKTMVQKDNTLFLGNYKINKVAISNTIKSNLQNTASFIERYTTYKDSNSFSGIYPYTNHLDKTSSNIKTFKAGDYYRLGVQFQHRSGKWSEAVYLKDYQIKNYPIESTTPIGDIRPNNFETTFIEMSLDRNTLNILTQLGFIKARPIVVYPTLKDRVTLCQGLIFPTVYNVEDRVNNSPFVQADWKSRYPESRISNSPIKGSVLSDINDELSEIQCITTTPDPYILTKSSSDIEFVKSNPENFYIDESILTIHSPELDTDELLTYDLSNTKLRIVGINRPRSRYTDLSITTSTAPFSNGGGLDKRELANDSVPGIFTSVFGNFNAWREEKISDDEYIYRVFMWHRNGSLNTSKDKTVDGIVSYASAKLDKKKWSVHRFCTDNIYYKNRNLDSVELPLKSTTLFNSNEITTLKIKTPLGDKVYYGNIDKIITTDKPYPIIRGNINSGDKGTEPVRMKYKSTPHIVVSLDNGDPTNKLQKILSVGDTSQVIEYKDRQLIGTTYNSITWDYINKLDFNNRALPICELYKDIDINTIFGGKTEEAILNNTWLPCGPCIDITTTNIVSYYEGDTYFQRYDCLKTYPFTQEDQNSVVDIISFLCESRINLDGRYDRNRGQASNLVANPTNFNLFNKSYTQNNNFFTYRTLDESRFSLNTFPNSITWSKTKLNGDLTDIWTNITLASTLEVDGDKGEITSLERLQNEIMCFQTNGISNILFNSRVQIPTTEGVPIEISNSYKVDGKRYLSYNIGTTNKWSIVQTPVGLYFIDGMSKGIYLLNSEGLISISDMLGFKSWCLNNITTDRYNGINKGFKSFYDIANNDIYFVNSDTCLCYSEFLKQFTSFMSYEGTNSMFNFSNRFLAIKGTKIWEQNKGEYNKFFGVSKPFYTTIVANPDSLKDKIYNIVEARANFYDKNNRYIPNLFFTNLEVYNDTQMGKNFLSYDPNIPSTLKKKFNIWRAVVPRQSINLTDSNDNINCRNRIRSPWAYVKLSYTTGDDVRAELHDIGVHYTI